MTDSEARFLSQGPLDPDGIIRLVAGGSTSEGLVQMMPLRKRLFALTIVETH
jgi:hypothetical protein